MLEKVLNKNRYYSFLLLASILLLGFFVREVKLYEVPRLGATFDEFAWTWLGMNIIQTGTPVSWSPHPQYENFEVIRHYDAYFRLVKPYLEHPPFFGLIAGSFALFMGATEPLVVKLYHIRPLALLLGVTSIWLVYYFAKLLFGRSLGFLSAFIYAIVPTISIGSRLVQNENFFIPLWLIGLIFVWKSLQSKRRLFVYIPALIAFLLVLSKLPFMAAGVSFFALYLFHKRYRDAFTMLFSVVLGFFAFSIYGFYFDRDLFLGLIQLQTQRYDLTYNSIFSLFEKPYLADRFFTDGWILWGFMSLFLLLVKDFKKYIFIIIPFLTYFGIYMAGIPDEPGHGWYRYPLYPFLIISIGFFLKEYFAKNYLLTFMFIVFIGTSLFQNVLYPMLGFSFLIFRVSIVLWSLILLPVFFHNSPARFISQFLGYSFFTIYILLSIVSSVTFID